MRRDLKGLRIIVTGASTGIGRCVVEQLAAAGARVAAAARSGGPLQELEQMLSQRGSDVVGVPTDVTAADDRQRLLAVAVERFGGLDVLINNAGVGSFAHFMDGDEALLREIMEVNFFAPAALMRAAIPLLAKGRQPAIVNVGSMCGRRGLPAWSEYSASKFALTGLSEALRAELTLYGIDVLLIQPGLTRTDLGRHLLRNTGRMQIRFDQGMAPEEAATAIVRALVKGRIETILGGEARWMVRLNRWVPRLVNWLIARKVKRLYADGPKPELPAFSEVREQKSEVGSQRHF
jgi:NAD(P)-dependent dehydrogenase (short-subunit alcohol dehydrogenase family)